MSETKKVIMLGNEAIARGAYEAGVRIWSNTKTIFIVNGLRMRRLQQKLPSEHLWQEYEPCLV